MLYKVVEIFKSVQGEGACTGEVCVFVRLSGCNLHCQFCDTNYSNFVYHECSHIVDSIESLSKYNLPVVFTGGEPLIHDLEPIIQTLIRESPREFYLETNGSIPCDYIHYFGHISLSPKQSPSRTMIKRCHSLKILYPYLDDTSADDFVSFPAENKFIQPIDNKNIEGALNEVERLGKEWKLGVQVHKLLNLR